MIYLKHLKIFYNKKKFYHQHIHVHNTTGQIVMRLMAPILERGHHLIVDNWHSSPPLWAQFPPEFLNRKMTTGDYIHIVNVLCLVWGFFLLSTFHRLKMVTIRKTDQSGNAVMKDHILVDYNLGMGFVNKNNTITTQHTMVRKSNKWTTKVALHLIEESLFNTHILYGLSSGNIPMKLVISNYRSTEGSRFGQGKHKSTLSQKVSGNQPQEQITDKAMCCLWQEGFSMRVKVYLSR